MFLKEYGKAKGHALALFGLEPSHNPDAATNGEYALLRFVRSLPEASTCDAVIDVGANRGDWTAEAVREFSSTPISKFFCVEPIPTFADRLRSRFASIASVSVMETALSSSPAEDARIFEIGGGGRMYRSYRGTPAGTSSVTGPVANSGGKKVVSHTVKMSTGDDLFGGVAMRPYLLKIDCDGHDGHILLGFKSLIKNRRPIVQFEYCDFWIAARSRLADVCRFLSDAQYRTYKLFPEKLVRFSYSHWFETYGYQNIVAVPAEYASFSRDYVDLRERQQ
jgi:FkbM family methyltransferase